MFGGTRSGRSQIDHLLLPVQRRREDRKPEETRHAVGTVKQHSQTKGRSIEEQTRRMRSYLPALPPPVDLTMRKTRVTNLRFIHFRLGVFLKFSAYSLLRRL